MRIVLDEDGVAVVEIDHAYLCRALSRPWAPYVFAPTKDQALILGVDFPLKAGWVQGLVGLTISVGKAKALIALGDRQTRVMAKRQEGPYDHQHLSTRTHCSCVGKIK